MESSKSKLEQVSRSMEARQAKQSSIPRRKFLKSGIGAVTAAAILGKKALAANRPLKIGYVSPQTGMLASFGETDNFVISEFRRLVQKGVSAGGSVRPIEIIVCDSQSDPNRAARVAAALIKSKKVDLMLVAGTADTVNPVADQCEINQTPCLSSDTAWQAYFFGRGGRPDKGFDWTYHFFWGSETISQVEADIFGLRPTNKVVGCLWPNDPEGLVFSDPQRGYPPVFMAHGYKVIDTGRFNPGTSDFSAQISEFKRANVEVLHGILPSPAFATFWNQAAQQGFKPKIAQIGKALLFPAEVNALGERAKNLATEIWWSRNHPFKSDLTGKSPAQLCDGYEEVSKRQWSQAIGFRYALFELALDVFKRAINPESAASVVEAIRATKYQSVVGPIQWTGAPPNEWTHIPVKNVCTTPLVGGQWVPGKKWKYDLVVVTNERYRIIPVQRQLAPL